MRFATRVMMLLSVVGLLTLPQAAFGQAIYGSIFGTVTDTTGAIVPGATITVTDESKGTSVTVQSNGTGDFTVEHLIPDVYDVKVDANGFKSYAQKGVQLSADSAVKIVAALAVGGSTEIVEVNADSVPQLKTDRADVAVNFNSQELENLPIPDHNFTNLQLLLPGAVQLGWSHAADENPQGSKQIQVDGQAFGGVNYTLDGTDNQDPILGIIVINPNSDSMSEAKIATQNFDAEFGKAVASVVTVQTKSGSNSFHGTAFDNRESAANLARDPFSQPGSGPIPAALKNQFGGSIGGPILKDKLFFFGDYQGVRQKVGYSTVQTVPTAQLVSSCLSGNGCNFSQYVAYGQTLVTTANPANPYQIYRPDGTPYPNAIIPNSQISPEAITLLKLLQPYQPNVAGSFGGLSNNYSGGGTGLFNSDQWDVRGDYTLNQKIHVFGRFSRFTDLLSGNTLFGPAGGSGLGLGGYGGTSKGANDSAALGTDIVVTSSLVTDIRLGYFRYNILTGKYDTTNTNLPIQGENISGTGVNSALTVPIDYGAPGYNVSDLNVTNPTAGPNNAQGLGAQYGAGLNIDRCNCPLTEREDQFQFVNNWTKMIGNHAVKVGADLRYARNLRVPSDNDRTGLNNFGTGPTSNGSSGGLGWATLVLGDVTAYNRYASTSTNAKEFQKRDFFYAQDTWRATQKLTVNAGLRYEFYFPETVNAPGNGSLLNLSTGYLNVAGIGGIPSNMGVSIAKNAWNPRIGLAYQWNPNTVIRGGYGRSFDLGVFGSVFGHTVTQNLPVLANQAINATGGTSTYAFNLTNPALTQGGKATGLSNYVPLTPNAQGLIVNPGASVTSKARPFTERLPTLDAWNVSVQRSLSPTISLTLAYVGNKGTHTLNDGDGNNTNPNEAGITLPATYSSIPGLALHFDPTNGGSCVAGTAGCTPATAIPTTGTFAGATKNQTLLQRYVGGTLPACGGPCGWTQSIQYNGDNQNTAYNAFQASLAKTYTKGLSLNINVAYQVGRDAASSYATWSIPAVTGNDSSIRRTALTAYGIYNLPFGRNQQFLNNANGFVNQVVSGWQFSPVVIIQSGLPFTLSFNGCGAEIPGDAPCYVNGPSHALRTGATGFAGGPGGVVFYPAQTLGTTFTDPGLGNIGNGGRNNAWGPNFYNVDISALKNFSIKERVTLQFRADAFNAFNHINFGLPSGNIQSAGNITGGPGPGNTTNPRQMQFTARVQF
ncbi:MAG TPA: TonB-dependent receptor [Edaphobacter sp.]|nr:TonB-dependent receptor [Edaphobacter sp.]